MRLRMVVWLIGLMVSLFGAQLWAQNPTVQPVNVTTQTNVGQQVAPPQAIVIEMEGVMAQNHDPGAALTAQQCRDNSAICVEFDVGGMSFGVPTPAGMDEAGVRQIVNQAECQVRREFASAIARVNRRVHMVEVTDEVFFGWDSTMSQQQRLQSAREWGTYLRNVVPAEIARLEDETIEGDQISREQAQAALDGLRDRVNDRFNRIDGRLRTVEQRRCGDHNDLATLSAAFNDERQQRDRRDQESWSSSLRFHIAPELMANIPFDMEHNPGVYSGGAHGRLWARRPSNLYMGVDIFAMIGYADMVGAVFSAGGRFLIGYQGSPNGIRFAGGVMAMTMQALGSSVHKAGDLGFLAGPLVELQIGPVTPWAAVLFGESDNLRTRQGDSTGNVAGMLGIAFPIELVSPPPARQSAPPVPVRSTEDCDHASPPVNPDQPPPPEDPRTPHNV